MHAPGLPQPTPLRPADIIGCTPTGDWVVVEVKRGAALKETAEQILRYTDAVRALPEAKADEWAPFRLEPLPRSTEESPRSSKRGSASTRRLATCDDPAVHVAAECEWMPVGRVGAGGDGLLMPALPTVPGVYQWVFTHGGRERRYVGEAANLRNRFEAYRRPGAASSTNGRMRERALRVLTAGGTVEILVAVDVTFWRDGVAQPADLRSKHARCFVENATLVEALATVGELINDRGYGHLRNDPILG